MTLVSATPTVSNSTLILPLLLLLYMVAKAWPLAQAHPSLLTAGPQLSTVTAGFSCWLNNIMLCPWAGGTNVSARACCGGAPSTGKVVAVGGLSCCWSVILGIVTTLSITTITRVPSLATITTTSLFLNQLCYLFLDLSYLLHLLHLNLGGSHHASPPCFCFQA